MMRRSVGAFPTPLRSGAPPDSPWRLGEQRARWWCLAEDREARTEVAGRRTPRTLPRIEGGEREKRREGKQISTYSTFYQAGQARAPRLPFSPRLLGFDGSLYGKTVRLSFVQRLRDERRFADVDALRAQIEADRRRAGRLFSRISV